MFFANFMMKALRLPTWGGNLAEDCQGTGTVTPPQVTPASNQSWVSASLSHSQTLSSSDHRHPFFLA